MIKPIEAVPKPDPHPERPPEPDKAPAAAQEGRHRTEPQPSLRLTIDHSENGLFYVYTLRDRDTGRIVAQLPREELSRVRDQPGYEAGTVVDTKA